MVEIIVEGVVGEESAVVKDAVVVEGVVVGLLADLEGAETPENRSPRTPSTMTSTIT